MKQYSMRSDLSKICIFLFALSFASCKSKQTIICTDSEMEGTILRGSKLDLTKSDSIFLGQVVAFKTSGAMTEKLLRVVGLPGDIIEIRNGDIFRNGELYNLPITSKKIWVVYCKDPVKFNSLTKYSFMSYSKNYSYFSLSDKEYNEIVHLKIADSIYKIDSDPKEIQKGVIQNSSSKYCNRYFWGPIKIPARNAVIDNDIWLLTSSFIDENKIGEKINEDCYFCIGDNFPEAKDSRYIGLIPKRNILGIVSYKQPN